MMNMMNSSLGKNASLSNSPSNSSKSMMNGPLIWFMFAFLILLALFVYYYENFMNSMQNISDSFTLWMTGKGSPPEDNKSKERITAKPVAPQDEGTVKPRGIDSVVEKLLPPAKDVFSVSKNNYTYYDAAPLCKALGAELATYDQVKNAWQKGADWCNYGWVKGQMAVYPTQTSTYQELQDGPEEQKGACGKPGVNGGYFDNPEMKFGVTCVGKKPEQSKHDVNSITSGSTLPLTAAGIEFEKKVKKFKDGSDAIGILPFNRDKWDD
jgi:hypothetical protein